MSPQTHKILEAQGIPFRLEEKPGKTRIILEGTKVAAEDLRRLGFRLGHGKGSVRYLLYYEGQFCGVVM